MNSCMVEISANHPTIADALYRALVGYIEGRYSHIEFIRSYQVGSDYIPFVQCVLAMVGA